MGRTKHNLGSGPFLNREMAKQGLIVGGMLGMPVIMSGGGYIDMYDGGGNTRQMTDEELEARRQKQKDIQKVKKCPEGYKLINGYCQKGSITTKEEEAQWHKRTGTYDPSKNEAFKKSMCQALSSGQYKGKTAQWLADSNIIAQGAVAELSKCENKDEIAKKQNVEEYDVKQLEETPETPGCQCEDPNGDGYQPKDENGKEYFPIQNDMSKLHELTMSNSIDFANRMVYNKEKIPVFNFGKYSGRSVTEVLKSDPSYYDWILKGDFAIDTKKKLTEIKLQGFQR
jgi:hypothetical protein